MKKEIDINCDLGESYGVYRYGADNELFPHVSSVNIACGFHAGDPHIMKRTVEMATAYGVRIGAHVGLPDRIGFGRRIMQVSSAEMYDYIMYQLGALDAFLRPVGLAMSHLKLHGALYMMAAERADLAQATVEAVNAFNPALDIYTLPGSSLARLAQEAKLSVVQELFADRPYGPEGVIMFGWSLKDIGTPAEASERVMRMLGNPDDGSLPTTRPDTVCVHSDTPGAVSIVQSVRDALLNGGWTIGRSRQPAEGERTTACITREGGEA